MPTTRRQALQTGGLALAASCSALAGNLAAQPSGGTSEWWSWRGPRGDNQIIADSRLPKALTKNNILSEVAIPGRGHSSPVVAGNHVYLTTADKQAGTQSVVAIDRSGKLAWVQEVHRGGIPAENHPKNTEASPSLAYDGDCLLSCFYNANAIRLTRITTAGKIVWQQEVGRYHPNQYKYGYAASPCVYGNLVIIAGDYDDRRAFLAAHDRISGERVWKIARPGSTTFSSPIITNIGGKDLLLLSGCDMVAAYDPLAGRVLWKAPGATTMATCGTMVWDGDMVFASGGYPKAETVGINAISGQPVWSNRVKCYEQSLLAKDGYLYGVADSGVAYCWKCSDGRTMWKQRLGGKYSSSPLLVGDTIHVFNESGRGFSFVATPDRFEQLGDNQLADEVFASPVVVNDTMFLRVARHADRRRESLLMLGVNRV